MIPTPDTPKNYEEIFIAIIEYIRDHPYCIKQMCSECIRSKFDLTRIEDKTFVEITINKVSNGYNNEKGLTVLIISPDALFYLMEYRELKHSLEESKQARKQATLSTWFAVAGIAISIIGLVLSYYSNK